MSPISQFSSHTTLPIFAHINTIYPFWLLMGAAWNRGMFKSDKKLNTMLVVSSTGMLIFTSILWEGFCVPLSSLFGYDSVVFSYQEKKHGKLEKVNFRCKDDNWVDFGMKENQLYISKDTDSFMRMFLRNYCLRPACYECHAKHYKKSDMTIADFWGIENVAPEMNDGRGTSLVITRTEKGQKLFDSIKSELKWKEVSYEEGVKGNPSEYKSVARPQQRDTFFTDLEKLPFEEIEKKYAADIKVSLPRKVVRKIKRTIKIILGGYHK